jgi:hypothetical protein
MTDETLWIITANEIPEEEDTEGAKNPWQNNPRGGAIEAVAQLKQVSVQKLEQELSNFLRIVSGIFDRAENAISQETGVKLAEIELSVEITGEGDIKLLGTGIKAGTKGGLTLKFKKDQRI